jgi:serine/threonine protein phosphatase PrpC
MSSFLNKELNTDSPLTDSLFNKAINEAYDNLDAKDDGNEKKMGTTLDFLCLHRGGCFIAHIGDSRIYHIRPNTRTILYRSRDHSLVNDLYDVGELTIDEIKTSKSKNVITRAMQPKQENRSKADIVHVTDICPGDYFYMCSDGMLESMDDKELLSIICSEEPDENKREKLIEATKNNQDNHSAYLIHIIAVESELLDASQPNDELKARANNKLLNDEEGVFTIDEVSIANTQNVLEDVPNDINNKKDNIIQNSNHTNHNHIVMIIIIATLIIGFICFVFIQTYNKPLKESNINKNKEIIKKKNLKIEKDEKIIIPTVKKTTYPKQKSPKKKVNNQSNQVSVGSNNNPAGSNNNPAGSNNNPAGK